MALTRVPKIKGDPETVIKRQLNFLISRFLTFYVLLYVGVPFVSFIIFFIWRVSRLPTRALKKLVWMFHAHVSFVGLQLSGDQLIGSAF